MNALSYCSNNIAALVAPLQVHAGPIRIESWQEYDAIAARVESEFSRSFSICHFDYLHPVRLQKNRPMRFRKPYPVKVSYTDWGAPDLPVLVCCGGVANTARRFSYLAADLKDRFRVICMDWVGRGQSGWMGSEDDYAHDTYVEQLRQMIKHLGDKPVTLLGSSLGGSVAIDFSTRYKRLVEKLILNDIGPYIPHRWRARRAETLARFYVFRKPADMLSRLGASQKTMARFPTRYDFMSPIIRRAGPSRTAAGYIGMTFARCKPTARSRAPVWINGICGVKSAARCC